jgi:hypothetical protein
MASCLTPSTIAFPTSPNHHPILRVIRDRSPPQNSSGAMVCDHPECKDLAHTFRRLSEWNKHMDRHERPYKCNEPGCEASPGFTYPGGLLRHQREVHKICLTQKESILCPFPNCVRASGNGFTRNGNLEDHCRRRHHSPLDANVQPEEQASRKRQRLMTPQPYTSDCRDIDEGENENCAKERQLNSLVNHLCTQLVQKDEFIRAQAIEISRLRKRILSPSGCIDPSQLSDKLETYGPQQEAELGRVFRI